MSDLKIGDLVRIPAMNATGRVVRVSLRLKHAYLVAINGVVELEKLPDRAFVPMLPPAGMP